MRRRDRLRGLFDKGTASPHALPSRPALTDPALTCPQENDGALQLAIQKHLATLPDDEKETFRAASQQLTDENLLLSVKEYDECHRKSSRFRPQADRLSNFLGLLDRFMAGVAIGVQAGPDISSLVVGAVRIVIDLAVNFVAFFAKLSDMLCRLGDFLAPLAKFAQAAKKEALVQQTLANVYGDLLQFARQARDVFIDRKDVKRTWTSWRLFWQLQWVPFEENFGKIETNFKHHLTVLQHSAQGLQLNASLEASYAEERRRERERIAERESFLDWVSKIPFEKIHEEIYAKKHPGTGEWLIQTAEFQSWFESPKSSLLWCHGKPGAGKSVLAANVLEYITIERALLKEVGIAFAYYNYQSPELQDLSLIISAFVKQLCRKKDVVPPGFLKFKQDSVGPSALGNQESFTTIALDFEEVFLVIDALDECHKDMRNRILGFITAAVSCLPCIKVFVTSRREQDIMEEFGKQNAPIIQIEAKNVAEDISKYVHSETKRLREGYDGKKLFVKSDVLEAKIISTLVEKAEGMFLWVNLQLASLCRASESKRDSEVEKSLKLTPSSLEATYFRVLDLIDGQTSYMRTLASRTFMWALYASRPLRTEELQHALASEEPSYEDDNKELELDDVNVILKACANLLVEEGSVIRPIHYSVQEFFTQIAGDLLQGRCLEHLSDPNYAHTQLASTCMLNLQMKDFENGPCSGTHDLYYRTKALPFAWYAACNFDNHLSQAGHLSKDLLGKLMMLLERKDRYLAAIMQLRSVQPYLGNPSPDLFREFDPQVSKVDMGTIVYATKIFDIPGLQSHWKNLQIPKYALHRACSAGLRDLVARLLASDGCNVDEIDNRGMTAIYYAASIGETSIVEMMLQKSANINIQGGNYGNALQAASWRGHKEVVQMLLDRGADINAQGGFYGNALQAASGRGDKEVVQMLLDRGADINAQGGEYGNALQAASQRGHNEVAQMLLDRGADINAQGGEYGHALQAASWGGHEEVVQMLLDRGADINAQGGLYRNTLQAASEGGYREVAQMLLDRGADINAQGGEYGNALQAASWGGDKEVVQMLLDRGADINAQGGLYGHALQVASQRGDKEVVQMLLDRGADINAQGGEYGNALQAASWGGHKEVVQMLLDRGADINAQGGLYGHALQVASQRGDKEVVQMLLDRGANINAQGGLYGNALQAASERGYREVAQMLLDRGAQA